MRLSKSVVPTLREDPADAEAISHKLMLRAGLVRQLAAGIYVWLPLGQRVLDRINAIIREEMNAIGGQEMTMPVLHPAEIWRDSGRWDAIGPEMFRLKDRNDRDMCLAMTHEEVIAWLVAREIRSYRDLPQIWYQMQTKERDEPRRRAGGAGASELDARRRRDAELQDDRRGGGVSEDRSAAHDQVAVVRRAEGGARAGAGARRPQPARAQARPRAR